MPLTSDLVHPDGCSEKLYLSFVTPNSPFCALIARLPGMQKSLNNPTELADEDPALAQRVQIFERSSRKGVLGDSLWTILFLIDGVS
jgi:hypothetical protein